MCKMQPTEVTIDIQIIDKTTLVRGHTAGMQPPNVLFDKGGVVIISS